MHRFINQDPIGIWGDANNLGSGFAYVAGMVVEASDPSGLWVRITIIRDEEYTDEGGRFGTLTAVNDEGETFSAIVYESVRYHNQPPFAENVHGFGFWQTQAFKDGHRYKIQHLRIVADSTGRQIHNGYMPEDGHGCFLIGKKITNRNPLSSKDIIFSDSNPIMKNFISFIGNDPNISIHIDPKKDDKKDENIQPSTNAVVLPDGSEDYIRRVHNNPDGSYIEFWSDNTRVYHGKNGKIEWCAGPGCEKMRVKNMENQNSNYPSDPNEDPSNAIQKILMNNILAKMLKRGEPEQPPVFIDTSTGPNGAIMIYKNPYYKNKDPLKTILFNGDNGSGRPMIYRNPFTPGAEYGYDSTTYERWQQSGFVQPNVDPYFE